MFNFGSRTRDLAVAIALTVASTVAAADGVSFLYVEDAASGTLTGSDDQHLRLTLNNVRDYVTIFTDRPVRASAAISARAFYDFWPQAFATSAPNVVVSHHVPGSLRPQNIVLTLTNPQYDAKKHSVSFDAIRILQDSPALAISGYQSPIVKAIPTPKKFTGVSLFIDDTHPTGGFTFTDQNG